MDEHDRAAEERDSVAEQRDQDADARDATAADSADAQRDHAAQDRSAAAQDRLADATDRGRAARDRERAMVDDLTGVLRRGPGLSGIEHEIDRARRERAPLVVAFVDVVGLKQVNDTYGHAGGDRLLRDVANALKLGLRSYDLVARYGGDEFVCALPGIEIHAARARFTDIEQDLA